uniref:PH domain-containing protein n=1 Tax=Gopherus agassizii TaxID=38772 RepID=A0A452HVG9_9SAUR
MSGSTARKIQPFTISTKLSLPKCTVDFPGDSCSDDTMAGLDNCTLRQNLNECVPLYLAQAQCSPVPPGGGFQSTSPTEEGITDEDQLNRNSLARSIKKITLSNWHGEPGPGKEGVSRSPVRTSCERNHNNNNSSRTGKAQFKVFLRKEVDVEEGKQETRSPHTGDFCSLVDKGPPFHMVSGCHAPAPWKESVKNKEPSGVAGLKTGIRSSAGQANVPDQSLLVVQFNREIMQAESWVRGKLRDLKDGCNIQDWERVAQTLQRDMRDFENTLIKLNQMGEQLMGQPSPSVEIVRRQLLALKEQWQLLKQTAGNQSKALGGLRNLQEFNRRAEQLEAWIRQKEEKPVLTALLQESMDKIQLTRRILDLKQEEQQFQGLHEEMNSLAQKLEKHGKSESRSISARRKHLNKMWLRLQGTLKEHHETLQLALEVAAFLQQADTLLRAIHAKWRNLCGVGKQGDLESSRDRDVRDIASQVMMLDVTVSQLISLHPSLAARVLHKHRDVKESWAQLQQVLRNETSPLLALVSSLPMGETDALSPEQTEAGSGGVAGREAGDKRKRVPLSVVQKDFEGSVTERVRGEEGSLSLPGDQATPGCHSNSKRRRKPPGQSDTVRGPPQQEAQLQDFCQAANAAMSRLRENVSLSIRLSQMEDAESLEAAQTQQAALQQEILSNSSSIEALRLEGQKLLCGSYGGRPQVEGILQELEGLWAEMQRMHRENDAVLRKIDKVLQLVGELDGVEHWLQGVVSSLSEPATMRSPEELRRDLQEISCLENQVLLWGIKLQALREEMGREPSAEHVMAGKIQSKVEKVEEKLGCVRAALQRRAEDLRDSLVLSEFLQNVQQEEVLSQRNSTLPGTSRPGSQEPVHLPLAQAGQQLSCEDMSSPLGELQEAVEMLNDVVKERERVMEAAAETESLEHLLARVSPRMEAIRCRAEGLARDITRVERGFATVKSELDLQGLQGLLSQQQEIEFNVSEALEGDMEELEKAVIHLEKLCPARMHDMGPEIQGTLQAWEELRKLVLENKGHVQRAGRLQQFFGDYLAMISWTEDTRAQIFSESVSAHGLPETQWEELDGKIEAKFKEFEELAATGQTLVSEEHYLSETIKERLEELQSMLGWVLVRWRAQKHHWDAENKSDGKKGQDDPLDSALSVSPSCQDPCAQAAVPEADGILGPNTSKGPQPTLCSLTLPQGPRTQLQSQEREVASPSAPSIPDPLQGLEQSWEDPGDSTPLEVETPKETLVLDSSETPVLLVPQPGPSSLGGTVNLILSIGKKGEKKLQLAQPGGMLGEESLHRLPGTKPSGCKTFWKRCQGLLGNTLGSLKRKKKPSRRPMEEVSTYLHVKEKERDRDATCRSSTMPQPAKRAPTVAHASLVPSPRPEAAFHTLPKISSSSLLSSLKRKGQAKADDAKLFMPQGIMGAGPSRLRPLLEEKHNPSNTWPPKCSSGKKFGGRPPSPRLGQLLDLVKNPLGRAIEEECGIVRAASGGPKAEFLSQAWGSSNSQLAAAKSACRHLSLGSVLSLELPKDLGLLGNVQDAIKVAQKEVPGREEVRQDGGVILWDTSGAEREANGASPQKETLKQPLATCQRPRGPRDAFRKAPQSEGGTWFEEVSFNPSYRRPKVHGVGAAPCGEKRWTPRSQGSGSDDFLDFRLNRLSRISVLHEQIGREWDKLAATLGTSSSAKAEKTAGFRPRLGEATKAELRPSPTKHTSGAGRAPSTAKPEHPAVNGKLREDPPEHCLEPAPFQEAVEESLMACSGQCTNLPILLSVSECQLSAQPHGLASAGLDGQGLAPDRRVAISGLSKGAKLSGSAEVCHPDHELFEEEEEELQAIWRNVEGRNRQSPCANTDVPPTSGNKADKAQSPEVSSGRLILTSANNMLVAKFTLPTSTQLLQSPDEERGTSDGHGSEGSPRRFWASLPCQDDPCGAKEAASVGSVESTCPQSRQTHQEEDRDVGKTPPSKVEFQMMEGTLERKHVLQTGGRKATCRTWNLFHAVLMRQTLCFYQDRKDTLKSSVVALPLNLSGAQCTQETEYTKKTNCFRLQLRDGSEYLLKAPSQLLMNQWVSKLQQNSGFPEVDYFQALTQPAEGTSSAMGPSKISGPGSSSSSHLLGHHQPVTAKNQEITLLPRSSARLQLPYGTREDTLDSAASQAGDNHKAVSHTTGHRQCQWLPSVSPRSQDNNYQEEEDALMTHKRRSHSFTSATYQKITPVSVPKESLEAGSSYSITLYIGEQAVAMPRARCHSFVARPGSPREGTPSRHKNKSVFKKFFGKKE